MEGFHLDDKYEPKPDQRLRDLVRVRISKYDKTRLRKYCHTNGVKPSEYLRVLIQIMLDTEEHPDDGGA